MECIIIYRAGDGTIDAVRDDRRDFGTCIAVFPSREAAERDTQTRKLFKTTPFKIVELGALSLKRD